MNKSKLRYSEWNPEFSKEALDHIERVRESVDRRIELMRVLRRSLGLTQVEVAQLLGVTQANVSKIERRGDPSLSVLSSMAEAKGKRLRLAIETEDGREEASFLVG